MATSTGSAPRDRSTAPGASALGKPRETGKRRALRIPLDYFKQANPLERRKLLLSLVALLAAGGWVAYLFATGERGQLAFSHGPVAAVHAQYEAQCDKCHVPFEPIAPTNLLMASTRRGMNFEIGSDKLCISCHVGPPHHDSQDLESTPNCGGCHRDHLGRDASLVRLPDATCTCCHRNLTEHTIAAKKTSKVEYVNDVSYFPSATGHPEFRVLKDKTTDPGVVKFNHKLHLTPGQTVTPGQLSPWTLGRMKKIDPASAERYRAADWQTKKGDDAEVVLNCGSCHQPDSNTVIKLNSKEVMVSPSAGAYMQPINFEMHCQACHPLQFDDANDKAKVPHHLQPDQVRAFVTDYYKGQAGKPEAVAALPPPNRPLPGKPPAIGKSTTEEPVPERIEREMRTLFIGKKTCGECHYAEGQVTGSGFLTAIPKKIQVGPTPAATASGWYTQNVPIPRVWYTHAKFDHSKHRTSDCRVCHMAAYPFLDDKLTELNPGVSTTHWDVMMPGVANCRTCHAPTKFENGVLTAGSRHECTECHVYHHGDGIKRKGPNHD